MATEDQRHAPAPSSDGSALQPVRGLSFLLSFRPRTFSDLGRFDRRLLLAAPVVLALAGCALGYPGLREANTKALASLELGMPKAQVIAAMGTTGFGDFDNPADREKFVLGRDATRFCTTTQPSYQTVSRSTRASLPSS